nr:hypothetical protein CFP56_07891 [Quercus suber]
MDRYHTRPPTNFTCNSPKRDRQPQHALKPRLPDPSEAALQGFSEAHQRLSQICVFQCAVYRKTNAAPIHSSIEGDYSVTPA